MSLQLSAGSDEPEADGKRRAVSGQQSAISSRRDGAISGQGMVLSAFSILLSAERPSGCWKSKASSET